MRVYERLNKMIYDEIDMRNARAAGYWLGCFVGAGSMFFVCFLVGLYFNS